MGSEDGGWGGGSRAYYLINLLFRFKSPNIQSKKKKKKKKKGGGKLNNNT